MKLSNIGNILIVIIFISLLLLSLNNKVMENFSVSDYQINTIIYDIDSNWEKDFIINNILKNYSNINTLFLKATEIKSMNFLNYSMINNCVFVFSVNSFTYDEAYKVISKLKPNVIIICSDEWGGQNKKYMKFADMTKILLHQYNNKDYNYNDNTIQIPLGYSDIVLNTNIKPVSERHYIWSFIGKIKQDRKSMVDIFKYANLGEFFIGNNMNKQEMYEIYCNSIFIPNGRGNVSLDCFRLYEASVAGAIPIIVGNKNEIDITFKFNGNKPPWVYATDWNDAINICRELLNDLNLLQSKQIAILNWWTAITDKIRVA